MERWKDVPPHLGGELDEKNPKTTGNIAAAVENATGLSRKGAIKTVGQERGIYAASTADNPSEAVGKRPAVGAGRVKRRERRAPKQKALIALRDRLLVISRDARWV
jgi:hypothetical protein